VRQNFKSVVLQYREMALEMWYTGMGNAHQILVPSYVINITNGINLLGASNISFNFFTMVHQT
jgi:hypothetical protein